MAYGSIDYRSAFQSQIHNSGKGFQDIPLRENYASKSDFHALINQCESENRKCTCTNFFALAYCLKSLNTSGFTQTKVGKGLKSMNPLSGDVKYQFIDVGMHRLVGSLPGQVPQQLFGCLDEASFWL